MSEQLSNRVDAQDVPHATHDHHRVARALDADREQVKVTTKATINRTGNLARLDVIGKTQLQVWRVVFQLVCVVLAHG